MRDTFLIAAAAPLAFALVGCAATQAPGPIEDREAGASEGGECSAEPAQRFIGRTASSDTGAAILAATNSRTLRWGPPDSMFTMDYRPDRVTVMYDAQQKITEIRCG
ncbi:MAG: I78 family peptidase inhibitor [Erythrobacter sp.]|nr:I78 family peptidase inhibitor [Erythrobacter sp.]